MTRSCRGHCRMFERGGDGPYNLNVGPPCRTRTCGLRLRAPALWLPLSYGWKGAMLDASIGRRPMRWHRTLLLAVALFVAAFPFADAMGQATYPEKPLRLIVPFPAGGATDILARLIAERLAFAFGKPVVVENVSGAAGATGTAQAAKAAPDGYTLLTAVATTTTLLPHLRRDLPYDPLRDFEAVTLVASFPNLLVVRPAGPATPQADLGNSPPA